MSVIHISTDLEKPSQSAFFRLYLLLEGTSCGETEDFTLIAMDLCCVLEITCKTSFSHWWAILVDANDRSGLYPCIHLALLNDLGSVGWWMRVKLFASHHLSTRVPSSFVDLYPHSVLWLLKSPIITCKGVSVGLLLESNAWLEGL